MGRKKEIYSEERIERTMKKRLMSIERRNERKRRERERRWK